MSLLSYQEYGNGAQTLVICHGLLGSADNWRRLCRWWSETYRVIAVDLRNHGQSFHHEDMTYDAMAQDVFLLLDSLSLERVTIIGHSMGGKVVMQCLALQPTRFHRAIIVDIAPKSYDHHHDSMLSFMKSADLEKCQSLTEIESCLKPGIPDQRIRQFVMTNIKRSDSGVYHWRIGLDAIIQGYPSIMSLSEAVLHAQIEVPTLFIKGEFSDYISVDDSEVIYKIFKKVMIEQLDGVGHWVQAEDPEVFFQRANAFLSDE